LNASKRGLSSTNAVDESVTKTIKNLEGGIRTKRRIAPSKRGGEKENERKK